MAFIIRPFSEGDQTAITHVMQRAIRSIGPRAYSPEQVAAWASGAFTPERVLDRIAAGARIWVAADESDTPVAYSLLEPDGHLDHLYCDPDCTGNGLAQAVLAAAERDARSNGCEKLYTEASELARATFERAGYAVTHRRDFTIPHECRDVPIHNYAMEKALS